MHYIETLWKRMVTEKRIDLPQEISQKKEKMLYESSIEHKQLRELGIEWLSLQSCL
jgi:hypothetical protein